MRWFELLYDNETLSVYTINIAYYTWLKTLRTLPINVYSRLPSDVSITVPSAC